MAFYRADSREDAQECPVCYECLSGSERTLSCGHVFCHDCLVKTLVSINSDGNIRDTLACPVCRHLTFIRRQKEAMLTLTEKKDPGEVQTLEVQTLEVPLHPPPQLQSAPRVSSGAQVHWLVQCYRSVCERVRRHRLISPSHKASQIFIISAEGRPMVEEDVLSVVTTVIQHPRRRRRRICTTARCLLILLSAFTLLALVAATLPWILLA